MREECYVSDRENERDLRKKSWKTLHYAIKIDCFMCWLSILIIRTSPTNFSLGFRFCFYFITSV